VILFITINENPEFAGIQAYPDLLDQVCTMCGYDWGYLDLYGDLAETPTVWTSLQAMWDDPALADHDWVYFDGEGEQYIDEFEHPAEDVVYVTGANEGGYRDEADNLSNGTILKMRTTLPERNTWHVGPILLTALTSRWLQLGA
jgi:hypothetical protein